ncbi:MAG: hypothetical protein GYB53_11640 [Rhodobacteraceae bacterium]|nr:hypothetical protein [Paracoccaceae bacterium]MBR9820715.1 hypothetical protein [Paracoccaceae bacterium]
MSEAYWPTAVPSRILSSTTAGRQDDRASFQPEIGPAKMRPRSTGRTMQISVTFDRWTAAQLASFEDWYDANQSARFHMRDPITGAPARFQIAAGEEQAYQLAGRQVSMNLVRMPGSPWWGGYVPRCSHVPPLMVADYAGEVFALDTGSLRRVAEEDLVNEADNLVLGAWRPAVGTWAVRFTGAAGDLFPGTLGELPVAGDGRAVVAFDGSATRLYLDGQPVASGAGWVLPAELQVLDGTGTVSEVLLFPEALSDAACIRASQEGAA